MSTLEEFLRKRLRLRVNRAKSAVDRPWKRKFLGYSMTVERTPRNLRTAGRVDPATVALRAVAAVEEAPNAGGEAASAPA